MISLEKTFILSATSPALTRIPMKISVGPAAEVSMPDWRIS